MLEDTYAKALLGHWWMLAVRGLFAVIFGIIALVSPGIALLAFIIVFAVYAILDGIIAIVVSIQERSALRRWRWILLEGILSIVAGVFAIVYPGLTALAFLYIVAIWAIVTGITEIIAAFAIRKHAAREWLLGLAGLFSIAFGIILTIHPGTGLLAILWLVGIYAIIFGLLFIIRAFQLRTWAAALVQTGQPNVSSVAN